MLQWWGTAMSIRDDDKLLQNQLGISLVEVIVGIALMLIIIGPIVSSLTTGIKLYQYNMAQSRNITSARESLNIIADELRYATTPVIYDNYHGITYIVAGQNRKIYIGSGKDANTLIIEHDEIISKKAATNTVKAITFRQDTNKIIISLQLNDNSYTKSPELDLANVTVVLQNM